jgi:hypothetical protein
MSFVGDVTRKILSDDGGWRMIGTEHGKVSVFRLVRYLCPYPKQRVMMLAQW